ncbi:Tn3 family transposase [Lentzea sp. CC55]|uniref:Tn3 family transposase n=1 Tax=Lentzea sp. CC55 TaxID=2884909 RepID=UPI0035B3D95E
MSPPPRRFPTASPNAASCTPPPQQQTSRHLVHTDRIARHWPDMLRAADSPSPGEVRGYDLIRMLSREVRPTGLGDAFARHGRTFQSLHVLQAITDGDYRRMLTTQLNISEGRHTPGPADLLRPSRRTVPALPPGEGKTSSAPSAWP